MRQQQDTQIIYKHIKTINILFVDDSKVTQLLFESTMKNLANKIVFSNNGEEGYNDFLNNKIDLVITDYDMPIKDGLSMIKDIRQKDASIPIILLLAIDDLDVIREALHLNINTFVKKPIIKDELLISIENMAKITVANNFLQEQRDKQLLELKANNEYTRYQEDLGFAKELNILRNDYYYQMSDYNHNISLIDFLYHPLDVMSGDAYSARRIDDESTLYLVVDGMGKGLSASLTAMIFTSFANHIIDKMLSLNDFDFSLLISETMQYIKPVLLDEEALSLDYVYINYKDKQLLYSKFSMPPILMQNQNNEIIRIKSNNPPLSKYSQTFNIDTYDTKNISKFLIYTDGIVESNTTFNKPYSEYIEDDFLKAFTREDLNHSFIKKIQKQEDDITLIFINNITQYSTTIEHKRFKSLLSNLDVANKWYEELWDKLTNNTKTSYRANIVFTELFMNAHEHGNLNIPSKIKHSLIESDLYFETLAKKELNCEKYIDVKVEKITHNHDLYIITKITDEGNGFDTQILTEIFRNSRKFHGRGVFVSRKNSFGIFYNAKGNSVLFINKIENQTPN